MATPKEQLDSQNLTRRDRNKLRNRQEILDAALAVFSERGYHEASIQEIADRADFAVSTIYALFDNKESLYRASYADLARRCGEVFDKAMAQGKDEYEKLVNFVRAKGEIFQDNPDGIRLYINEVRLFQPVLEKDPGRGIKAVYDRFMLRIADLFASGIQKGIFRENDPMFLALALDGMTNEFAIRWLEDPERYPYLENVERMIEIFFGPVLISKPRAGK